ncbi:alpha/beta hydrolase [Lacticaseibacillus mingshuiensis]|uniref:Alpha/beta hydrolase n=1 Tax=Lacticaseibacillus mingshuiensis TaxID=2799574 RepID=A0ABW4CHY5_9LACO|nr:alpha/beta hydrolase family protein [Lacticaseibacillus mingshuiensis]
MALMQLDYYSSALQMSTLVNIIVPDEIRIAGKPLSETPVLWMLHGLSDDGSAPLRLSKLELYAQETGLVVVMPSAGRSFYLDDIHGQNYFTLVSEELPHYLHLLLGLSNEKALNHIAGISMGGYGAARIALTHPERYSHVDLLSGVLDTSLRANQVSAEQQHEFPFLYGDAARLTGELNPLSLLENAQGQSLTIHVFCGTSDGLLPMSQNFVSRGRQLGLEITGSFSEGDHEWRFWDRSLDTFTHEL